MVIMDFCKTFEIVPHQTFFKTPSLRITGKLHRRIQNSLTMRTQQVVLEGVSSSSITVTSGVPQGSRPPTFYSLPKRPSRRNILTSLSPG